MSKTAARRVALFASSSLGLAAIASVASLGLALTPTAAAAQATCVSTPPPNNNITNDVVYPAGTYNPGITCTYVGDSAEVSTAGAITVSTSGGVPGDPLVNGINLRATGTDDIAWDSTAGTVTGGNQTNGPLIDARTAAGNIDLNTAAVTGSQATITHGIYAQSTGGGDVNITTTGTVNGGAAVGGRAGIEAISGGGNGDISIDVNGGIVGGRLYGIRAQASGAGDVTINVSGSIATANVANDVAAIDVTTGSGLLTINAPGTVGNIGSRTGSALRIDTGGDAVINVGSLRGGVGGLNPVVDMTTSAGTQTSLTHSALARGGSFSPNNFGPVGFVFRGAGAGDIAINSNGRVEGYVDFAGHTGDLDWNIAHEWYTAADIEFGSGDSTIRVTDTGLMMVTHGLSGAGVTGQGNRGALEPPQVFNFGAGDDTFENAGFLMVGVERPSSNNADPGSGHFESETRFEGLETFVNSGTIVFGTAEVPSLPSSGSLDDLSYKFDAVPDDILVMPGTTFVGGPGSRIILDVDLTGSQTACDAALRSTATHVNSSGQTILDGSMPAADCIALPGGATEGETAVVIMPVGRGDRGGTTRIVLVDVAGGTSDAGHFVLDPTNLSYVADQGGYLDRGYFIMPLVYDPETQQHVLVGVTGQNAWQTATWAQAAHDLWRVSTGSWFDRQADLRGGDLGAAGGGVWLRTSGQISDRDVIHSVTEGASTFIFDNGYEQSSYAITGGIDLLAGGGADSAWVIGLMAGYANSELDFAASPNTAQLDGWTGGAYATYIAGGLFVDAVLNANRLEILGDMPGLGLSPSGTLIDTRLLSVGAQVEAGWRFGLGGGLFVEPLAGLSYVSTTWDDLNVPSDDLVREGVLVDFNDPTSLRGSLGARFGLDLDYGAYRGQLSLLGRLWEEFDGEADLTLGNIADDAFVSDAFTGSLMEFGVGASIAGEFVSGFINVGGKWGDDYSAQTGAAGVRVNW